MTSAPTLRTSRLMLRHHTMDDFDLFARAMGSDHARFMGGPMSRREAWRLFCADVAQWSLLGHGAFAVVDNDNGSLAAQVGINGHPHFPETELGWLTLPESQGKGYAFEAAQAVRDWAYKTRGITDLVSYIHPDNTRSIALAERLEATLDASAPAAPFPDHVVYRHPAPGVAA
ncbi:MAG: GNAT family N-acetyltransferase [Pseudomonadota bacterium]